MANVASKGFRKCSADLVKVIQDHDLPRLAWELYADGLVLMSVMEEVNLGRFSVEDKKTKLLRLESKSMSTQPGFSLSLGHLEGYRC